MIIALNRTAGEAAKSIPALEAATRSPANQRLEPTALSFHGRICAIGRRGSIVARWADNSSNHGGM
jgi:hypothetical protein